MFCEAFHRVFKYKYLKGKSNKRVDKCLLNLIKYNRDKTFDRLIKLTKGKMTQKISTIQRRHRNSLTLSFESITKAAESWLVKAEDGKRSYGIALNEQSCTDKRCSLRCVSCNICVHAYMCSCTDYLIYSTICKHIHLLHRFRERHGEVQFDIAHSFDTTVTDITDEKTQEITDLTQMVKEETKADIDLAKRKCQDVLMELLGRVQETDERHLESVKHVLKGAIALKSTLESMIKNPDVVKLDPVLKFVQGKKIEPQRRFYSTTKRKRKVNVRFAKPTDSDKESFMQSRNFGEGENENVTGNSEGRNEEWKGKITKLSKGKRNENKLLDCVVNGFAYKIG